MLKRDNTVELSVARANIKKAYIIIFSIGIPYLIFVLATDIRIPCILYELTGFQCPGCGITRMFMSIARLRFRDAFYFNPFAFTILPVIFVLTVLAYIGKPKFVRNRYFLSIFSSIGAVLALLFGIMRNFC